jgi:hypothetical protein
MQRVQNTKVVDHEVRLHIFFVLRKTTQKKFLDFIVTDEGLDCQVSISAKERNIFLLHQI